MSNLYYELSNGELVPKHKVDAAFELIERLKEGCSIVGLSDIDVFTKGDKLDAILRYSVHSKDYSLYYLHCLFEPSP